MAKYMRVQEQERKKTMSDQTKYVYVVTLTEGYEVFDQYAFFDAEKAEAKEIEMNKKYFEDDFNESDFEFEEGATFMDYQHSEAWSDDNCFFKVHMDTTIIE